MLPPLMSLYKQDSSTLCLKPQVLIASSNLRFSLLVFDLKPFQLFHIDGLLQTTIQKGYLDIHLLDKRMQIDLIQLQEIKSFHNRLISLCLVFCYKSNFERLYFHIDASPFLEDQFAPNVLTSSSGSRSSQTQLEYIDSISRFRASSDLSLSVSFIASGNDKGSSYQYRLSQHFLHRPFSSDLVV